MIPVRKLQRNRDLAHIQVSIGAKSIDRDCCYKRAPVWCASNLLCGPSSSTTVRREDESKRGAVVVEHPRESRSGSPVGDRLSIQTGSRLIGRIPRTPWAREWQRADVACDLLSLEIRKPVKPGSSRNRSVGIAKIFEITTIVGVTVRTMGSNLWGVRKSAGLQLGVEPKLFPSA